VQGLGSTSCILASEQRRRSHGRVKVQHRRQVSGVACNEVALEERELCVSARRAQRDRTGPYRLLDRLEFLLALAVAVVVAVAIAVAMLLPGLIGRMCRIWLSEAGRKRGGDGGSRTKQPRCEKWRRRTHESGEGRSRHVFSVFPSGGGVAVAMALFSYPSIDAKTLEICTGTPRSRLSVHPTACSPYSPCPPCRARCPSSVSRPF
jgi:hypothetical protein